MSRSTSLIREIFDHVPRTYKGLNYSGEHIVQLCQNDSPVYATLEKLSYTELVKLARQLKVAEQLIDEVEII